MQDRMLQFFAYEHLPEKLQLVSKPFGDLARLIAESLPSNPERTVALRKISTNSAASAMKRRRRPYKTFVTNRDGTGRRSHSTYPPAVAIATAPTAVPVSMSSTAGASSKMDAEASASARSAAAVR
jgi:hypothetical protein